VRLFTKSAITAGFAGVLAIGMSLGGAVSAHAEPPSPITGAGSDTTYFVMAGSTLYANGLDHFYNASQAAHHVTEIPPSNVTALGFPASVTVPGDNGCPTTAPWGAGGSYTWNSSDAAHTPPNGSSAGITALQNDGVSAHKGCLVDFARSSRGLGKPTDTPDLQSFAYALDAVTWAVDGALNTHAPQTLTIAQITGIYTCHTSGALIGQPIYSNWNQVGGTTAPIIKYVPQTGSGTLSFFQTKLLGGATADAGCNATHLSHRAEENQLTTRCTNNNPACAQGTQAIPAGDYNELIAPYSYAKWNSQANHAEPDLRHGAALKKVNGVAPSQTTINETASRFVGTRYVYNITTEHEPDYAAITAYIGINQLTHVNGFLCATANATNHTNIVGALHKFGFTPLVSAVEGSGQPIGYCRYNPTAL